MVGTKERTGVSFFLSAGEGFHHRKMAKLEDHPNLSSGRSDCHGRHRKSCSGDEQHTEVASTGLSKLDNSYFVG